MNPRRDGLGVLFLGAGGGNTIISLFYYYLQNVGVLFKCLYFCMVKRFTMKRFLFCFGIVLFLLFPSCRQVKQVKHKADVAEEQTRREFIKISNFREIQIAGMRPIFPIGERDINGMYYSYIFFHSDNISQEDLSRFRFYSDPNTQIILERIRGNNVIHITHRARKLSISHPEYGTINIVLPPLEPHKKYAIDLTIENSSSDSAGVYHDNSGLYYDYPIDSPNESNSSYSYYVSVYDKNGHQFSTALLISTSGKQFIRIQSRGREYDEYVLKESDKEGFTYMTTGKSEIEPLYVK